MRRSTCLHRRGAHGQVRQCLCDCGQVVRVERALLTGGESRSCGCLRREVSTTHGKTRTPQYRAWHSMKSRCTSKTSPAYPDYGGRGITVCATWPASFEAFLADVGPRPGPGYSLDRIDPNGPYEPANVRWAPLRTQANNKRNTRRITALGSTLPLAQWSRATGLASQVIWSRLLAGWSPDDAVSVQSKRAGLPASAT
jgi:hypothetical protein